MPRELRVGRNGPPGGGMEITLAQRLRPRASESDRLGFTAQLCLLLVG